MTAGANTRKFTFSVTIEGLDLSDEQQAQLRTAVQGAAAKVMAGLDFKGDRAALALPLPSGGRTQGIRFIGVLPEEVARILPKG